jgi:cysteinyl-tRNA synthetase
LPSCRGSSGHPSSSSSPIPTERSWITWSLPSRHRPELNRTRSLQTAALLKGLGKVLGVLQQSPRSYLQGGDVLDGSRIQQLIDARAQAKKSRDFAAADRIRDELAAQGVVLKDSAAGTTWVKA